MNPQLNKGARKEIPRWFAGLPYGKRLTCLVPAQDVGSSKAEDRAPPSNMPGFSFAVTRLGGVYTKRRIHLLKLSRYSVFLFFNGKFNLKMGIVKAFLGPAHSETKIRVVFLLRVVTIKLKKEELTY